VLSQEIGDVRLVRLVRDLFPDSIHGRDAGLKAADDSVVCNLIRPAMLQ
jgi:hypothetical protein